jgi:hypothetical protein
MYAMFSLDRGTFKLLFVIIVEECTCGIKSRIGMLKVACNKKRALFISKMDLEYRKKLQCVRKFAVHLGYGM